VISLIHAMNICGG
jgi:hypothetical protein